MFLASSYWDGPLNVSLMRAFETVDKAAQYIMSLDRCQKKNYKTGELIGYDWYRIYEVFSDKPPKLWKIEDIPG